MYWEKFFRENKEIHEAVAIAIATRRILTGEIQYPPDHLIYRAFNLTERTENIKVVILGQDPYHGDGEANGLAFSVFKDMPIPASLRNIYKELKSDLNINPPKHGDLTDWAKQGVLLLNTCLTVAKDKAGSHFDVGWDLLTDNVITLLSKHRNIVFILWGKKAQDKEFLIDAEFNCVIKSPHPAQGPANTGFFGSKPFSKCNEYLISKNIKPINWEIK